MRKYHQKQLLELLKTLYEAHAEVKRLLSNGETRLVIELLSGCQESAVRIGGFIEQLEGEGTKTVSMLEVYCELLYQLSVAINDSGNDIGILKRLQKQLFTIESSIKAELRPDRIEIVFLPYQLSMFDSFESIYFAAKADPYCNAYVVPIPYYELNPDGSYGKMHYDGEKYPPNIEVTDWREYNMEARHPDVIFTHYPYDDNITNISIHPDFYSKRLRDLTDLLCHVPYYVTPGDTVEEYNGFLPGIVYADRVIVESEVIRKSYIGHYRKADREFGWNGRFGKAEEKFITLGSPKYDKVINSKREDFKLPEEWLQRMAGKKVILLNTHMFAWLNGGEQYFEKLRYIFNIFRSRRDVVLWWRPHPNTEVNFRIKRPQLLSEYNTVIDEFKSGDWGIYDDTPDLHRAIAWSDAYYGDGSSLVALYLSTGKPVMLQNIMILNDDDDAPYLVFENFHDGGQHFWFSANNVNGLFRMDKQIWKAKFMGSFPGEPAFGRGYSFIAENDGKLYFAPFETDSIGIFDIEKNTFSKIEISEPTRTAFVKYNPMIKFSFAAAYKDWVFFFPFTYPAIIRLNTKTGELEYLDEWVTSLIKSISADNAYYFGEGHVSGADVTMFCANENAFVRFNMEECSLKIIDVCKNDGDHFGISFDGECYWTAPIGNPAAVVKLNPKTGEQAEIMQFPPSFVPGTHPMLYSAYAGGYVWMLPGTANESLKINVKTNEIEIADEFRAGNIIDDGVTEQWKFGLFRSIGDKLYAFDWTVYKLTEYDAESKEIRKEHIKIDKNDSATLAWHYNNCCLLPQSEKTEKMSDCIIQESSYGTLNDFLNLMKLPGSSSGIAPLLQKQNELCKKELDHADGTAGVKIYKHICSVV